MRITFLGTGTSTGVPQLMCDCKVCKSKNPLDKRLRMSIFLEKNDTKVLVDCGPDFRQQALREKITKIDGVILTHEHYDHIGGLDDLRPYCMFKDMPVFAFDKVLKIFERNMPYCFVKPHILGTPKYSLNIVQRNNFKIGDLEFTPIRYNHFLTDCLGFRCENIAYLTDIKSITDKEREKLKGVKVLIVDALRKKSHVSHYSVQDAMNLRDFVKPEQTWFIHMSHDIGLHEEVENDLPKGVHLSYDGLKINV